MKNETKCIIYHRVSTVEQSNAIQGQLDELVKFAREKEWTVIETIIDKESGASSKRKGIEKLFKLLHRNKSIVLFYDLSRFSRSQRDTITYIQRIRDYGCEFHSYSEEYISSLGIWADCIIAILSATNSIFLQTLREKITLGISAARARGVIVGRPKMDREIINRAIAMRNSGMNIQI